MAEIEKLLLQLLTLFLLVFAFLLLFNLSPALTTKGEQNGTITLSRERPASDARRM